MTTETTTPKVQFEYPESLQEYMISKTEYFEQHPEYQYVLTGIVVFDAEGKILLVQRAKDELAFPGLWEIPGGSVDSTDETLLHGAVRELREESGLEATRIVRKVGHFSFPDRPRADGSIPMWIKHVFEMEVKDLSQVRTDPTEHQAFVFATEEEVVRGRAGEIELTYISEDSKVNKLDAFRHRKEAAAAAATAAEQ